MTLVTICFALFFLTGVFGVRVARKLSIRFGWLDHPKGRSFHDQPMPRIGGMGVLLPLVGAVLVVAIVPNVQFGTLLFSGLLLPAFFIAALSFVEDCVELSRKVRFLAHLLAASWVVWAFQETWSGSGFPILGGSVLPALATVLFLLWIVGLTNAYNFMDGIDGIAAVQGIIAALGWFALFYIRGSADYLGGLGDLIILTALIGGLLAFLTLNWSPAAIFLGDNGSTFLGFFFAVIPFYAASRGVIEFSAALEAGVLFTWPFILDPALAFLRRLYRREQVFEAHRSHVYQVIAGKFRHRRQGHQMTTLFFGGLSLVGVGLFWISIPFFLKLILVGVIWAGVLSFTYRGQSVADVRASPVEVEGAAFASPSRFRIFLSPPEVSEVEAQRVTEGFRSGFIAPVGPQVSAFEGAVGSYLNLPGIQAVSSGTAAIHLALRALGVGPGDCVLCPDLTFIASLNPIRYLGAEPVLIDVTQDSWSMDLDLARRAIRELRASGRRVPALVIVHAYGLPAPMEDVMRLAREEELLVLEDCAGAFGAFIGSRSVGTFGDAAAFSFNGNKVLTTSGGGAVYVKNKDLRVATLSWANQGKRPDAIGYEHVAMGYNYKLSNICAAIGLGQLETLQSRLDRKAFNYGRYRELLYDLPGARFLPIPKEGKGNYWLSCVGLEDKSRIPVILNALRSSGIEALPIWKPMHMQPANEGLPVYGGAVSNDIYTSYISLPSGSTLTKSQIEDICSCFRIHSQK